MNLINFPVRNTQFTFAILRFQTLHSLYGCFQFFMFHTSISFIPVVAADMAELLRLGSVCDSLLVVHLFIKRTGKFVSALLVSENTLYYDLL